MILPFHIAIALFSIIFAVYMYFYPSKNKVHFTYLLIALTLGSGTYLLWTLKTHVLQGCIMGLAFTVGVLAAVMLTNRKLAEVKIR